MILDRLIKEPWPRIIGIPLVSYLILVISHPADEVTWFNYGITLLYTGVMWNGDYFIIISFRKTWSALSDTHKRIISTAIVVCAYNLLADYVLCTVLGYFNVEGFGNYFDDEFTGNISKNLVTTFIVGTLYETGYFFNKWKKQTIEIEKVKSQQLKAELRVLKNQVSPHFLFNSLNTLVTLIHENQDQAARFTEKLSQVYRYILQHKEKEIIKLKTEMHFITAYNYLLEMRFEKSLIINIDIASDDMEKYIAPLSIQMLVENAVKHNIISSARPLIIDIYTENGSSVIVRNNLQRKTQGVASLKTGLENISKRYKYLSHKEVDIIETREHFLVALPLIELTSEPEYVVQ